MQVHVCRIQVLASIAGREEIAGAVAGFEGTGHKNNLFGKGDVSESV